MNASYLKSKFIVNVHFPTDNKACLSTHFHCLISPCIHYTVVNKGRTGVCDASTVLSYSCFCPCLLCLRTSLHSFYCGYSLNASTCIPVQLNNTNIHLNKQYLRKIHVPTQRYNRNKKYFRNIYVPMVQNSGLSSL